MTTDTLVAPSTIDTVVVAVAVMIARCTFININAVDAPITATSTSQDTGIAVSETIQTLALSLCTLGIGDTGGVVTVQRVETIAGTLVSRNEVSTNLAASSIVDGTLIIIYTSDCSVLIMGTSV
jgi:hypothetical protein